jgi:antitoxin component YwqK of YwqJK toxin-antitoxin module
MIPISNWFPNGSLLVLACALLQGCKKADPPVEVPRSDLVLSDGRRVRAGTTTAFTGVIVEHYTSGAVKSRTVVSSGVLHGISEGYHTNGVMQMREHFRNRLSDGPREKWYLSDKKMAEAMIQGGKLNGLFGRWDEARVLVEEIQLRDDKPDGVALAFHPDGSIKARVKMQGSTVIERGELRTDEMPATQSPRAGK